jgi:hypothetical protein
MYREMLQAILSLLQRHAAAFEEGGQRGGSEHLAVSHQSNEGRKTKTPLESYQ